MSEWIVVHYWKFTYEITFNNYVKNVYRGVQQKTIERFQNYREDLLSVLADFFFGMTCIVYDATKKFGSQGVASLLACPNYKNTVFKKNSKFTSCFMICAYIFANSNITVSEMT